MVGSSQSWNNITPPPLPKRKSKSTVWIVIAVGVVVLFYIGVFVFFFLLMGRAISASALFDSISNGIPYYGSNQNSTMLSPIDGMILVYIPEGEFYMGTPDGTGYDNEHPMTSFYLSDYWIDQTEVTNGMYAKCVAAGECTLPIDESSSTRSKYYGDPAYAEYPVIYVSMYQAQTYCNWAGRTLPSEPHWEKAAKGFEEYEYPWGFEDPDCSRANFNNCKGDTEKVRSHLDAMGYFGTYDMAGNAAEWTISAYWQYPTTESLVFGSIDPTELHVLRGGSWASDADDVRTSTREPDYPGRTSEMWGFRCMLPVNYEHLHAQNPGE